MSRLRTPALLTSALVTMGLLGCSTGSPVSAPTSAAGTTASAAPSPVEPPPAAPLDAKAVLAKLTAAGLPMSKGSVQDENTDPNNLLGRPNEYTSRACFDVDGADPTADKYSVDRGGVIEVFANASDARARADYIAGVLKAAPMLGSEYHYLAGPVLVRISGKVKPSVAAKFQAAVAALST
jgi:hypothetical protein